MWQDKVKEIIYILEHSDIEEIDITFWGKRIRVSKSGSVLEGSNPAESHAISSAPSQKSEPTPAQAEPSSGSDTSGGEQILSPMPGTFYRSSSPDSAPFIKEGDSVKAGETLCIIEAMKIMNEIEAEQDGVIQKILVEDGKPVEYNQPLFVIGPS